MPLVFRLVRFAAVASLSSLLGACVVESGHSHYHGPPPPPPDATGGGETGGTMPPAPTTPMLVEVDTDQTMTADPGQGVGVFVEYGTGGKWHVSWTCDTVKTNKDCAFDVTITSAAGPLANLDTTELAGGAAATPEPTRLEVSTRTAREIHGVRFDTAPGGVIELEASVSGLKDGSFLFFVQDGKVNGGYTGVLTNPLRLQGKTP